MDARRIFDEACRNGTAIILTRAQFRALRPILVRTGLREPRESNRMWPRRMQSGVSAKVH